MAKLPRVTQRIFAGSAANNGVFGSAQAGAPTLSTNIATLMAGTAYLNGWNDATISGEKLPPLEEFQGLDYIITTQLAYLFENGIPEYDSATTYYINSVVRKVNTYQMYGSKINNNTGNALPAAVSDSNWEYLGLLGNTQTPPTRQYLKTGTTYTTPANCKALLVRMVGAGGGGGGGGGTTGGVGGNTSFNSIVAAGGNGGTATVGGTGAAAGSGTASLRIPGSSGRSAIQVGGAGADSAFGGGGPGGYLVAGLNGTPNTGGGGGGGYTSNVTAPGGAGGQSGEYVELFITGALAATYTYAIGTGGTAGVLGGSNQNGGAGGSGFIIVEEFY